MDDREKESSPLRESNKEIDVLQEKHHMKKSTFSHKSNTYVSEIGGEKHAENSKTTIEQHTKHEIQEFPISIREHSLLQNLSSSAYSSSSSSYSSINTNSSVNFSSQHSDVGISENNNNWSNVLANSSGTSIEKH